MCVWITGGGKGNEGGREQGSVIIVIPLPSLSSPPSPLWREGEGVFRSREVVPAAMDGGGDLSMTLLAPCALLAVSFGV